jgi:uncharacterized membrane protein YdjX (TVP38/TMEM64 family)
MNKKINKKNLAHFWSFGLIIFYLFGFRYIEPYILPPVQAWIQNSGTWAGFSYFLAGLVATVIAPISLGPINVVLQKGFGFWTSFGIFYSFITIGQMINFGISRRFGSSLVHKFFPFLESDPLFGWLRKNLDRKFLDLILIYCGKGGEVLAYLFGLSKVSFAKFVVVIMITNLLNAWLFVSKNLSIGDNTMFTFYTLLSVVLTFAPLLVVFRKELMLFASRFKKVLVEGSRLDAQFKQVKRDFENKKISQKEFDLAKQEYKKVTDNALNELFYPKVD